MESVSCERWPLLVFHFWGPVDDVSTKTFYGYQNFRGDVTFRGELDDFTDKISFTYCKLYGNKNLTFLNQLKMCLF